MIITKAMLKIKATLIRWTHSLFGQTLGETNLTVVVVVDVLEMGVVVGGWLLAGSSGSAESIN